jgi:hypothetical protein
VEPSNCRGFFFGLGKRSMRYGEGRFLFHLRMGEGDLHQHLEHVNSQQLREPITRFKNIISEVRNRKECSGLLFFFEEYSGLPVMTTLLPENLHTIRSHQQNNSLQPLV